MASSSLRRCPTNPTPRSFKSSAVKLGRTVSSILFSRNAASYCSRPRLRSQPPTSMTAPLVRLAMHDPPGETACLGYGFFEWSALGPFATGLSQRQVRAWSAMPPKAEVRALGTQGKSAGGERRGGRPAHAFTQGPGPFPRAPGKRTSGQMARFTVFQLPWYSK